jgi:hypothetical protein
MIPVNISLHGEFVPGDIMQSQIVYRDGVDAPAPARISNYS